MDSFHWPFVEIPAHLCAALILSLLAYQDLSRRRLPNILVGTYAALFLVYAWASGMEWTQLVWHAAIGLLALILAAALFALRVMGGGDVKLWGALMLWAGPQGAISALLIATLCGALMGILGVVAQKILRRNRKPPGVALFRALSVSRGVPYGVGLVVAGLHTLYLAVS